MLWSMLATCVGDRQVDAIGSLKLQGCCNMLIVGRHLPALYGSNLEGMRMQAKMLKLSLGRGLACTDAVAGVAAAKQRPAT